MADSLKASTKRAMLAERPGPGVQLDQPVAWPKRVVLCCVVLAFLPFPEGLPSIFKAPRSFLRPLLHQRESRWGCFEVPPDVFHLPRMEGGAVSPSLNGSPFPPIDCLDVPL